VSAAPYQDGDARVVRCGVTNAVIPAQAGIQYGAAARSIATAGVYWIPAVAGMTMVCGGR